MTTDFQKHVNKVEEEYMRINDMDSHGGWYSSKAPKVDKTKHKNKHKAQRATKRRNR